MMKQLQGVQDSLDAVSKLLWDVREKFTQLGELFVHIKHQKLYKFKGYESFRDYLEQEHNMPVKLGNDIIRVYGVFVVDRDIDPQILQEIGFDRLLAIAPAVEKADWKESDELLAIAREMPLPLLKSEIKKRKAEQKSKEPNIKDVLVDQWKEAMCELFNCTWKDVQFKLALWFGTGGREKAEVRGILKHEVRIAQSEFEREVTNG